MPRGEARALVGTERFVEVYVDTPLTVCEARDTKGLYAKARRAELAQFTGIDDPYEPPDAPELRLNTVASSPEDNARRIVALLRERGFVRSDGQALSANMSETVTPWKFSVEGEAGLENDERIGAGLGWGPGDRGGGEGKRDTATVHGGG